MKDIKDMKRILLKLSGEALAGDKRLVLTKPPVWMWQDRSRF